MKYTYDERFFEGQVAGSLQAARAIVPHIVSLVRPHSVVDVGCGLGTWLKVFQENGIIEIRGFDGDYVDQSRLMIDPTNFTKVDLTRPLNVDRRYDLAICVEVAEHLPERSARYLIRGLTSLAPAVVFSAAIPGQGGLHHLNLQWPPYWQGLFAEHQYVRLDAIRPKIWRDQYINWWYRQNILLYASPDALANSPVLREEASIPPWDLELIHSSVLYRRVGIEELFKKLLIAVRDKLARKTDAKFGARSK
ncbi:MAG: class I SAM-dependent methyltransferase [Candidatus Korobacteraceae bacterium]